MVIISSPTIVKICMNFSDSEYSLYQIMRLSWNFAIVQTYPYQKWVRNNHINISGPSKATLAIKCIIVYFISVKVSSFICCFFMSTIFDPWHISGPHKNNWPTNSPVFGIFLVIPI